MEVDDPPEDFELEEEELAVPEAPPEVDIRGREEDRGILLNTEAKLPLADNYPLSILAKDIDALVVELPVLVAQARSDFEKDYWLIAEVRVNGSQVGESRQLVTSASLSDLAASFAWLKVFVPVADAQGTVEFIVSQGDPETGEATALFSVSTAYSL